MNRRPATSTSRLRAKAGLVDPNMPAGRNESATREFWLSADRNDVELRERWLEEQLLGCAGPERVSLLRQGTRSLKSLSTDVPVFG